MQAAATSGFLSPAAAATHAFTEDTRKKKKKIFHKSQHLTHARNITNKKIALQGLKNRCTRSVTVGCYARGYERDASAVRLRLARYEPPPPQRERNKERQGASSA